MSFQSSALRVTDRLKYEGRRAWGSGVAAIRGNGIKAYWFTDVLNFGDLITPLLLRHYGFSPIYERPNRAELVATGSLLEHLPEDFRGIILGSGFIEEKSRMSFPKARVLAVRGELSRQRIGGERGLALGDPGLLASDAMPRREQKKFALGIVPHCSEKAKPVFGRLMERLGNDATLIDPQDQPLAVFLAIDQCEHILSSSLHGLIVADSLGIPNGWVAADKLWGGRFKFDDYSSSFGIKREPVTMNGEESLAQLLSLVQAPPNDRILERKEAIRGLWMSLPQYL
jgi:pyruvyltransferase